MGLSVAMGHRIKSGSAQQGMVLKMYSSKGVTLDSVVVNPPPAPPEKMVTITITAPARAWRNAIQHLGNRSTSGADYALYEAFDSARSQF